MEILNCTVSPIDEFISSSQLLDVLSQTFLSTKTYSQLLLVFNDCTVVKAVEIITVATAKLIIILVFASIFLCLPNSNFIWYVPIL